MEPFASLDDVRLIPAHAGKTVIIRLGDDAKRAHPRSRGENVLVPREGQVAPGSSPLTRGKLTLLRLPAVLRGLIPAHAGKTRLQRRRKRVSRAHPRSRGENAARSAATPMRSGSSPLTRGKRSRRRGGSPRTRLIPAHAGKTLRVSERVKKRRAHPRSRGENGTWAS